MTTHVIKSATSLEPSLGLNLLPLRQAEHPLTKWRDSQVPPMSQTQAAAAVGLKLTTWRSYEFGDRAVPCHLLKLLELLSTRQSVFCVVKLVIVKTQKSLCFITETSEDPRLVPAKLDRLMIVQQLQVSFELLSVHQSWAEAEQALGQASRQEAR